MGPNAREKPLPPGQTIRDVLLIEPRLRQFRVKTPRPPLLDLPLFACLWLVSRLHRADDPEAARFIATAPHQPRPRRVVHAAHLEQSGLDLSLVVEGQGARCILQWGNAQLSTSKTWGPGSLARIFGAILDDRVVLVRTSTLDEHGMGGPWYHTLYDGLYDRAEGRFLYEPGRSLERCCEAAAYSWSGAHDSEVAARRCDQAVDAFHSYAQPASFRLPDATGLAHPADPLQ